MVIDMFTCFISITNEIESDITYINVNTYVRRKCYALNEATCLSRLMCFDTNFDLADCIKASLKTASIYFLRVSVWPHVAPAGFLCSVWPSNLVFLWNDDALCGLKQTVPRKGLKVESYGRRWVIRVCDECGWMAHLSGSFLSYLFRG